MSIVDDLKKTMLASDLDDNDVRILAEITNVQEFFKDAVIFKENDKQECLYILVEGKIAIERRSLSGRHIGRTVIQNIRHGQIIGEMGFVERRNSSATATAKSHVRLAILKFSELDSLIQQNPRLGTKLLRTVAEILSSRLRRMNEQWLRSSMDDNKLQEFEYF